MELLKDVLGTLLVEGKISVTFSVDESSLIQALDKTCFFALEKIHALVCSELDDFYIVEEIVGIFEEIGSSCGSRHDF